MDVAGIVEMFDECGVVGLEPARDCAAEAFSDCIVPIWWEWEKKYVNKINITDKMILVIIQ